MIEVKLRNEFLGTPGRGIISNLEVDVNSPINVVLHGGMGGRSSQVHGEYNCNN